MNPAAFLVGDIALRYPDVPRIFVIDQTPFHVGINEST
jgi:hypothetical protein